MGTMSCARKGCDNIMVNRYSMQYGYICNECFEELVDKLTDNAGRFTINMFMNTPKIERKDNDEKRKLYAEILNIEFRQLEEYR